MSFMKVESSGLEKVKIPSSDNWRALHHGLYNVSPEQAEQVTGVDDGVTVWDVCFVEDLLQLENPARGRLLDVGWYPHADPSGSFRLVVVQSVAGKGDSRSPFDWGNPILEFETRSIDELCARINGIVGSQDQTF